MIWRLLFLGVYVLFFLIRSPHGNRQSYDEKSNENLENSNLAVKREGKISTTMRSILSLIMLLGIIVYGFYPSWLIPFSLALPNWLRLTGLGLAILTLPLLHWAHSSLGRQYSPDLELKEEHKLISSGPYKVIRHPMYTILIVFMLSISIFSANTLIFLPHLGAIILILLRLSKEEAMLIQEFGDDYREYMMKTGRLLPRFN